MNEWLKRKEKRVVNRQTLDNIDNVVKHWQVTGKGTDKIFTILHALADKVMDYLKPNLGVDLKEEVREEMISGCLVRLHRANTDKGRSYNYFMTIMLAILRQHTMTRKNLKDMKQLKEQYREYIASRNSRNRNRRQA